MAKRSLRRVSRHPARALLSDTLPFEVPLTFSNRGFVDFAVEQQLSVQTNSATWLPTGRGVNTIVKILLGTAKDTAIHNLPSSPLKKINAISPVFTRPYQYRIRRNEHSHRVLSVPHPRNQLEMASFYGEFAPLITYYCSISPFSIRHPVRVAKSIFHRDTMHRMLRDPDNATVEESKLEYEVSRSYFVYERYSFIHKFYESYQFHRNEKKFDYLIKTDISKCFDSIYTHSLPWAVLGKDAVKRNLTRRLKSTFVDQYDVVMQRMNYNETNGILIGPEFSRIFAEMILQKIDVVVSRVLQERYNLKNRLDYDICRYIDDYFIFYNRPEDKIRILEELGFALDTFGFALSNEKTIQFDKPIITPVSIAKQSISRLLDDHIALMQVSDSKPERFLKVRRIMPRELISEYKRILFESKVRYGDVLNFTLSIVAKKLQSLIKAHDAGQLTDEARRALPSEVHAILEFTFFVYSVEPRVNTTVKLCHSLVIVIAFLKRRIIHRDTRHWLFKLIFDNIVFVLKKCHGNNYTRLESLYLLVVLPELGKNYWLESEFLAHLFDCKFHPNGSLDPDPNLDYFAMTLLLFYMKDKARYGDLRDGIELLVVERYKAIGTKPFERAEHSMLFLDFVVCPYVSRASKQALFKSIGASKAESLAIVGLRDWWFTRWEGFDLGMELEAKQGFEVY